MEGALVRSGRMPGKKFDKIIFPPDEEAEHVLIPEPILKSYREQISKEQASLLGDSGVLRDKQPVFYLMEGGELVFLSHTMMLRLPYLKSPKDFVPFGLRREDQIDLAEAIFGYSSLKIEKRESCSGRISVVDATLVSELENVFLSETPITPSILSGPKPTTFQHYLVQKRPDAEAVGKTKDGKPKTQVYLSDYACSTPNETVIRGHKLYWHKGESPDINASQQELEHESQLTHILPVKPGVQFTFRVYFENLNGIELGALLWALTLHDPGKYCHKLGMGKPLGMGSVKIDSVLHLTDQRSRYQTLFDKDNWYLGENVTGVESIRVKALQAFERLILNDPDLNPERAESLADVPRIKTMLTLLSWPGPDPEKTRYMDLKEFKDRKVLPTLQGVIDDERPAERPDSRESGKKQAPRMAETPTPARLKPGQVVEAIVSSEWSKSGVRVDLPNGLKGKLKCKKEESLVLGDKLTVIVRELKTSYYTVERA